MEVPGRKGKSGWKSLGGGKCVTVDDGTCMLEKAGRSSHTGARDGQERNATIGETRGYHYISNHEPPETWPP